MMNTWNYVKGMARQRAERLEEALMRAILSKLACEGIIRPGEILFREDTPGAGFALYYMPNHAKSNVDKPEGK